MTENIENQNMPKTEQAESVEAQRETAEDLVSPENIEGLSKQAGAEIGELQVYGQETIEKIAQEAGVAVDKATKNQLTKISGEAIQAGDALKQELGKVSKETREAETIKQEFEYRDAEGNVIGKAIVEMSQEDVEGSEGVRGKVLKFFRLEGEKDGEPTSIDVLALANLHKAEITLVRGVRYNYEFKTKKIMAPFPESPIDIAILLHELGHADQNHDEKIEGLSDFYDLKTERPYTLREEGVAQEKTVERLVRTIIKAAPSTEKIIKRTFLNDNFSELIKIQTEKRDIFSEQNKAKNIWEEKRDRVSDLQKYMAESEIVSKLTEEEKKELKSNLDNLYREDEEAFKVYTDAKRFALEKWRTLGPKRNEVFKKVGLEESDFEEFFEKLLYLPTQIMERDATARAIGWIKKIRSDAGIDLFIKTKISGEALSKESGSIQRCVTSVQEGIDAPQQFEVASVRVLKAFLSTYGAEKPPLAKRHRQKVKKE